MEIYTDAELIKNISRHRSVAFPIHCRLTFLHQSSMNFQSLSMTSKAVNLMGRYQMTPDEQHIFDCTNGVLPKSLNLSTISLGGGLGSLQADLSEQVTCEFQCNVAISKEAVCGQSPVEETHDVGTTMWMFVSLKIGTSFFTGLTYTIFEVR